MTIRYTRSGGRTPPRDREVLEIGDDGAFTLWRSVGSATDPPTPVGSFAGKLEARDRTAITKLADAARQAGDLNIRPKPDSSTETISLDGATARLGALDQPEEPWGPLITRLRELLGELTSKPRAALALEVTPDGTAARLVQQGSDSLELDLTKLTVRAVLWKEYDKRGDWHAKDVSNPGRITADPGWSLDLPFDHGFHIGSGEEVVAYVTCSAFDGDQAILVALTSPRRLE
jgi:hypothetical protein